MTSYKKIIANRRAQEIQVIILFLLALQHFYIGNTLLKI